MDNAVTFSVHTRAHSDQASQLFVRWTSARQTFTVLSSVSLI